MERPVQAISYSQPSFSTIISVANQIDALIDGGREGRAHGEASSLERGWGMTWLLIIAVYLAPDNAVDWDGPWQLGHQKLVDQQFSSEAECRNSAIQLVGRLHQGMLAPIRYQCVAVPAALPKGASR